jgi:hypothetical protein
VINEIKRLILRPEPHQRRTIIADMITSGMTINAKALAVQFMCSVNSIYLKHWTEWPFEIEVKEWTGRHT